MDPRDAKVWRDNVALRRHYLLYQMSEEASLRAGKYIPPFGINTPDHVNLTRQGVGLGQGFESYNLEFNWLGALYSLQVAGLFGRPDSPELDQETGMSLLSGIAISDKAKIGVSYLYGNSDRYRRHLFGPFGMVGFNERLTLLTEVDFQSKTLANGAAAQFGAFSTQKLSYEAFKGFWVFGLQEWGKGDFTKSSMIETYGLGLQFFPRPHFDFNISFERERISALSTDFFSYGWLMSHFYL
jgi:hypothetical protein